MRKSLFISLSLIFLILLAGCGPKMDAGEMFAQANQMQKEGKYQEAVDIYSKLIKTFPDSKFAPQSQFMVGFIYANEFKDLEQAKAAYEKFLQKYPDHEMAKDARWEIDHLGQDINDIDDLMGDSSPESEE